MAPIRKGDGTPLDIPGVSEVRSGDGRVFFEADAIPDSVIHRYDARSLDASDGDEITSMGDLEGGIDLQNNVEEGPLYDENEHPSHPTLDYGGDSDNRGLEGELASDITGPFEIWVVVKPESGTDSSATYVTNTDETFDGSRTSLGVTEGEHVLDRHDADLRGGFFGDDWAILRAVVDGSDSKLYKNESVNATGTVTNDMGYVDIGNAEESGNPYAGHVAEYIIFDDTLSSSEEQTLYDRLYDDWEINA